MTTGEGASAPDTIMVGMTWDFGASETEEALTRDQLWDLIKNGRRDGEGRVTALNIWVTDATACDFCDHSPEQHDQFVDMETPYGGPIYKCSARDCKCEEYVKP